MSRLMPDTVKQAVDSAGSKISPPSPQTPSLPQIASAVEQNVKPVVSEAQRVAAQTSFSGRKAVSRGTMFLGFYLWLLSGAILLSLLARRTDFFPGDRPITRGLQQRSNPWFRCFMAAISEIGFAKLNVPLTIGIT